MGGLNQNDDNDDAFRGYGGLGLQLWHDDTTE